MKHIFYVLTIALLTGCQFTEKIGRPLDQGIIAVRELEKLGKDEGGRFKLASLKENNHSLSTSFSRGYFQIEDDQTATFVLVHDKLLEPEQVIVIRYLWRPKAQTGRTHLDPNATNSTITYYILSGKEAGIYRGAGMSRIFGNEEDQTLRLFLFESHLNLTDQSPAFQDLLTKADLSGSAILKNDPTAVHRLIDHTTRLAGDKLGYMPVATSVN